MDWKGRAAALVVAASVLVANGDWIVPPYSLGVLVLAIALAWRYTDRFWSTVLWGAIAGMFAGLLIMGPGFRLAMRVVAILDPIRTPEFSLEGTLFIVVGIGGVLGGIMGLVGNLIRHASGLRPLVAGLTLGVLDMVLLLSNAGLREEFFELGAGPWMNIPMFGLYSLGYGVVAMLVAERLAKRRSRKTAALEEIGVPA